MKKKLRPKVSKEWLYEEYLKRSSRNPSYSLRAFSRLLDIPSGRLSQLMSQKRNITPKLAEKISDKLSFDPEERCQFVALTRSEKVARKSHSKDLNDAQDNKTDYHQLSMDQFKIISNPVHFDVLNLIETDDFKFNVSWMAKRLKKTSVEIRDALDRLERAELVVRDEGRIKRVKKSLSTTTDISFPALKKSHKEILKSSIDSLDEIDTELRDVTSMTMSIDMKKIPEAKKMILEFRRSLANFLESDSREEVYRLNIQLVPVTEIKSREKIRRKL